MSPKKSPVKFNLVRSSTIPVYEQIANHLKARIEAGEFTKGQKLPGIKVLSKMLGVNHLTLRQAIRTLEEERIVATKATRGTFVLGDHLTKLHVALILPNLNESSSRISAGVQEFLSQSESSVNILHFNEEPEMEIQNIKRAVDDGFDGIILFPSLNPLSMKSMLQLMIDGFPTVLIDRRPPSFPCWSAASDNLHGGYLATEHLIKKGCKHIACVSMEFGDVHNRYEGFIHAMGDHNLPIDFSLVKQVAQTNENIEQLVLDWMNLPNPPDGIYFTNDFQAFRGINTLRENGYKVPTDVRVVGFDDLSICGLSTPAITTVRQDFAGVGRAAARLLTEQIKLPKEKRFISAKHENVPVELIVRGSST